jgi:hypothetical protein
MAQLPAEVAQNFQTRERIWELLDGTYKVPRWPCLCYNLATLKELMSDARTISRIPIEEWNPKRGKDHLLVHVPREWLLGA